MLELKTDIKIEVADYNEDQDYHLCKLLDGSYGNHLVRIDLVRDGFFKSIQGMNDTQYIKFCKNLKGARLTLGSCIGYIYIAGDISWTKPEPVKNTD